MIKYCRGRYAQTADRRLGPSAVSLPFQSTNSGLLARHCARRLQRKAIPRVGRSDTRVDQPAKAVSFKVTFLKTPNLFWRRANVLQDVCCRQGEHRPHQVNLVAHQTHVDLGLEIVELPDGQSNERLLGGVQCVKGLLNARQPAQGRGVSNVVYGSRGRCQRASGRAAARCSQRDLSTAFLTGATQICEGNRRHRAKRSGPGGRLLRPEKFSDEGQCQHCRPANRKPYPKPTVTQSELRHGVEAATVVRGAP